MPRTRLHPDKDSKVVLGKDVPALKLNSAFPVAPKEALYVGRRVEQDGNISGYYYGEIMLRSKVTHKTDPMVDSNMVIDTDEYSVSDYMPPLDNESYADNNYARALSAQRERLNGDHN